MDCLRVRRGALVAVLVFTLAVSLDSDESSVVELGDHMPSAGDLWFAPRCPHRSSHHWAGIRRVRLGSANSVPPPADDTADFEAAAAAEKAQNQAAERNQERDKAAADALSVAANTELSAQQKNEQATKAAQQVRTIRGRAV